jgi:hypothetical protein
MTAPYQFEFEAAPLESDFLREATLWLAERDVFEWRNNTGVARHPITQQHVRFGIPGGSDLLVIVPPFGRFLGLETKAARGRQSKKQRVFQAAVERAGGVYAVARTLEEVRQAFKVASRLPALLPKGGDRGDWMCTYTGRQFWPLDPSTADICIEDIAHALSLENRYGGHLPGPYSVAQHCLLAARIVREVLGGSLADERDTLMHDAAEAYLKDIPRPLKLALPGYKVIESRCEATIAEKFGLRHPMPPIVKRADQIALAVERRDLFPASHQQLWSTDRTADQRLASEAGVRVKFCDWRDVEQLFLAKFASLFA